MPPTTRWAVGLEYDGTGYAGWQTQGTSPSIQSACERAFSTVADHSVALTCAGRTDAGVHAIAQVAHFDTQATRTARSWVLGANAQLEAGVSALWAVAVAERFHARYSAVSRTYRYLILNRSTRPAIDHNRVCWVHAPLDAERMATAAAPLVGEHDFSAFRAAECQSRTPMRRVEAIDVKRIGAYVTIEIRANAFLHHMVRNIAGVLLRIGSGEADVGWAQEVLAGRDRRRGGVTAPPSGLYLVGVSYPAEFGLPPVDLAGARPVSIIMP
jgi:tRNA pseudouridine38-40 synthase